MNNHMRPGVYVKEQGNLPFSVTESETAIPAFIGYTEDIPSELINTDGTINPKKITSLLEYEALFGGAVKEKIQLDDDPEKGLTIAPHPNPKFLMYYALQLFFANGGGLCYVVSVGKYSDTVAPMKSQLKAGLDTLQSQKESTLIVFPEATKLDNQDEFYQLYNEALTHASAQKNCFVIMDTYLGNSTDTTLVEGNEINTITYFRDKVNDSSTDGSYGAVYFPHLNTSLTYNFDTTQTISHKGLQEDEAANFFLYEVSQLESIKDQVEALENASTPQELADNKASIKNLFNQAISIVEYVNLTADITINLGDILATLDVLDGLTDVSEISAEVNQLIDELTLIVEATEDAKDLVGAAHNKTLEDLKGTTLYYQIKQLTESIPVVLPPSAAIAGVYARVDSTKGIWKAPANVGLNYVTSPTEKISDAAHNDLNVDDNSPNPGKSINAIRSFRSKGTIVWGARTLDGNSDEWRYISARRLFGMIENAVENATMRFIEEPNRAHTWLRAKATVENYLYDLWRNGALQGKRPEDAYTVQVGKLQDGDETEDEASIMNIEIGLAVVRPAEFVTLNFSHKLQQS